MEDTRQLLVWLLVLSLQRPSPTLANPRIDYRAVPSSLAAHRQALVGRVRAASTGAWAPDFDYHYDDFTTGDINAASGAAGAGAPPTATSGKVIMPSMAELEGIPLCQRKCTSDFAATVQAAIKAGNHFERFQTVCHKYVGAKECIDKLTLGADDCKNREYFDVMTAGLKYMCIEQKQAFNATMECIDVNAMRVQKECENQCHFQPKLATLMVQSGFFNTLTGRVKFDINPEFVKTFMADGCDMGKCFLTCLRVKFNAKCDGSAGALLSEMLVRPFAETHNMVGFSTMAGALSFFVPKNCGYLMSKELLAEHRIDPRLDQNLRQMYIDRLNAKNAKMLDEMKVAGADVDLAEVVDADANGKIVPVSQLQQQPRADPEAGSIIILGR